MLIRKALLSALLLNISISSYAMAEEKQSREEKNRFFSGTFSGNVTLASDYILRGLSQNDESPALQANVKWLHDSGVFLQIGGSSVDYSDASQEIDFYFGYQGTSGNWFYNAYLIHFYYPGAASNLDYDHTRLDTTLGYDFGDFSLSTYNIYTPENFADSGYYHYHKIAASVPLPEGFSFDTHVARAFIEDEAAFGVPDYTEWGAGVNYTIDQVTLRAAYIDTNLGSRQCADGCGAHSLFSVTYNF